MQNYNKLERELEKMLKEMLPEKIQKIYENHKEEYDRACKFLIIENTNQAVVMIPLTPRFIAELLNEILNDERMKEKEYESLDVAILILQILASQGNIRPRKYVREGIVQQGIRIREKDVCEAIEKVCGGQERSTPENVFLVCNDGTAISCRQVGKMVLEKAGYTVDDKFTTEDAVYLLMPFAQICNFKIIRLE